MCDTFTPPPLHVPAKNAQMARSVLQLFFLEKITPRDTFWSDENIFWVKNTCFFYQNLTQNELKIMIWSWKHVITQNCTKSCTLDLCVILLRRPPSQDQRKCSFLGWLSSKLLFLIFQHARTPILLSEWPKSIKNSCFFYQTGQLPADWAIWQSPVSKGT